MKLRWFLMEASVGDIHDIVDEEDLSINERKKSMQGLNQTALDEDITMSITISCQSRDSSNRFLAIYVQIDRIIKWYCKICRLIISNQMSSHSKLRVYTRVVREVHKCLRRILKSVWFPRNCSEQVL